MFELELANLPIVKWVSREQVLEVAKLPIAKWVPGEQVPMAASELEFELVKQVLVAKHVLYIRH